MDPEEVIEAASSVLPSLLVQRKGDRFVLINRPDFDLILDDEPHHHTEVIIDLETNQSLLRIWGRTHKREEISQVQQIVDLCEKVFNESCVCVGNAEKNEWSSKKAHFNNRRFVSKQCQVVMDMDSEMEKLDPEDRKCVMCRMTAEMDKAEKEVEAEVINGDAADLAKVKLEDEDDDDEDEESEEEDIENKEIKEEPQDQAGSREQKGNWI